MIWILKTILKITFCGINILDDFWILYPQSNSLSINKKSHINIKCLLLNKTLHSVRNILHKTYQILSNDYNFFRSWKSNTIFRNHLPCHRILKMIRRNKWFNPPALLPWMQLIRHVNRLKYSSLSVGCQYYYTTSLLRFLKLSAVDLVPLSTDICVGWLWEGR